jgi:ATP-dependent RNA circularization protein (DNA/RNA ligase family)
LGHKALEGYFLGPVVVEEKIDGSQFSWGLIDGVLKCRSKGVEIDPETIQENHMFYEAVQTVKYLKPLLAPNWTYRAEYLQKPKHNSLAYDRIPKRNLIIFDINNGHESYLPYDKKYTEAMRLNMEVVPKLFEGVISSQEQFNALLDNISVLGGQKIEGIVCKRYDMFGTDKKCLLAKYVSEHFKENS